MIFNKIFYDIGDIIISVKYMGNFTYIGFDVINLLKTDYIKNRDWIGAVALL